MRCADNYLSLFKNRKTEFLHEIVSLVKLDDALNFAAGYAQGAVSACIYINPLQSGPMFWQTELATIVHRSHSKSSDYSRDNSTI